MLQNEIDPGAVNFREVGIVEVQRFTPLVICLPDRSCLRRVQPFQTLWKGVLQDRFRQKRSRDVDQVKPFGMMTEIAHASALQGWRSGTRKITATGNVLIAYPSKRWRIASISCSF